MSDKPQRPPSVSPERLGALLRRRRKHESLRLVDAANDIGLSPATLSRLERWSIEDADVPIPDTATLQKVAKWLGVTLAFEHDSSSSDDPLPDVVDAFLRADRNLKADDAAALGKMFRAAYGQFAVDQTEDEGGD